MKKKPVRLSKDGRRLAKIQLSSFKPKPSLTEGQKREIEDTDAACRYVMSHPLYTTILDSLREGTKLNEIARWLAVEGYLTVTEATMHRYLSLFRKKHRESIYKTDGTRSFDSEFPADMPELDTEAELLRLLRMQKRRVYSEYAIEQQMGKALNTTVKEVEEAREIIKALAIIRGQIKPTGATTPAAAEGTIPVEARQQLSELRKDEMARDRMAAMVHELLGGEGE